MKVLILSDTFPPDAAGGAGTVAYALARGVRQSGAEVRAVSVHHRRGQRLLRDDLEFPVYRIYSGYPERFVAYFGLWNPMTVPLVARVLDEFQPDVVHAHNVHTHLSYASLRAVHRRGLSVMLTAHDTMSFTYQKFAEFIDPDERDVPAVFDYRLPAGVNLRLRRWRYFPLRNALIRHAVRQYVDMLVVPSHALSEALRANRVGAPRVEVLHNGVDVADRQVEPERVVAFRREHDLEGRKVILFGGRVSRYKGGEVILDALQKVVERVTNVRLLILGRPEGYASHMLQVAAARGLSGHVHVAGWLSGEALRAAYHAADVLVTPSLYLDPFPTVNLEAMAVGLPVVGTCFGGTPEIVLDRQTGYIVNPHNVEQLADRLRRLLEDEALARRMGQAGRQRVNQFFSLTTMVERTLALYEDIRTPNITKPIRDPSQR